jgi:preprotein translocase SecE subunit
VQGGRSSGDDVGKQEKPGMVQGALAEVELIDWPRPGRAAIETLYVLAIVVGASAFLFGLNTALTQLSRSLY